MRSFLSILFTVGIAGHAVGQERSFDLTTQTPITYVLDYSAGEDCDKPAYVEEYCKAIGEAPPDLLHLAIIMNVNFRHGPIACLGDEDCHDGEFVKRRRISAERVEERAKYIKRFVEEVRKAGVKQIVPYICLITLVGDHEKRLGFWDFYDHWDEYQSLGLYDKPKDDPFLWNQQREDGSPRYFYPHDIAFFLPLYRYAASPAHPDWRRWMKWICADIARSGMDGVFVDNSNLFRDCGPHCRSRFEAWLKKRYSPDQLKELYGEDFHLTEQQGSLHARDSYLLWSDITVEHMADLRKSGEAIRKPFIIFPNSGSPDMIATRFLDCEYVMFERGGPPCGQLPGRADTPVIGQMNAVRYIDHAFDYRFCLGLGAKVRAAFHCSPPRSPNRDLFSANANTAYLGLAECCAFGGGGTFSHRSPTSHPEMNPARKAYSRHFREHRKLYEGWKPYAQAGVVYFADQTYYGDKTHESEARSVFDELMHAHILTDVVTERGLSLDNIRRYALLIVPNLKYLTEKQVTALVAYGCASRGLLLTSDTGTFDEFMRERTKSPLAGLAKGKFITSDLLQQAFREMPTLVQTVPADRFGIRVGAYIDRFENPRQIIVHVVNYDTPLGKDTKPVIKVTDLNVRLPLPEGTQATSVTIIDPKSELTSTCEVQNEGTTARFILPSVDIHAVCVIDLKQE